MKFIRVAFELICVAVIIASGICSVWYVGHGDIHFLSDVARDFLLLADVNVKKIVLIGPRSSTTGLFHGPLWMYLNVPAFLLGKGNPVAVGWFWILLAFIFLVVNWVVAKKLFGKPTAWGATALLATLMPFETRNFYNPYGALFVMPALYFFLVRYWQSGRFRYALGTVMMACFAIQFQMAVGVPMLILTIPVLLVKMVRERKIWHLASFMAVPVILSTFILFDVRHGFLMLHSALSYVFAHNRSSEYSSVFAVFLDRIGLAVSGGLGYLRSGIPIQNHVLFLVTLAGCLIGSRDKKKKAPYALLAYLYFGHYLLSAVNKSGGMLYQYYMPLYPLSFMAFASLTELRAGWLAMILLTSVLWRDCVDMKTVVDGSGNFIGKNVESWRFMRSLGEKVYSVSEDDIGLFLYSPDTFAYQERYAVYYAGLHSRKKVSLFVKKPVTYIVVAPPPPGQPFMGDAWWRINRVRITEGATGIYRFPNGYEIQRYELTPQDIATPFDPGIDTGLYFR